MEKQEDIAIIFDPSKDEVIGVFKNIVFIKTYDYVLQTPREEYIRVWNNWLNGKQDYCELYKDFCGVMGHTFAKDYKNLGETEISEWSRSDEDYRLFKYPTYFIERFESIHDFEHG